MKTYLISISVNVPDRKYYYNDIEPFTVRADDLQSALKEVVTSLEKNQYIEVTENAMNSKNEMYNDLKDGSTVQSGYVITAHAEFENINSKWIKKVIELWMSISELANPFENITI